MAIAQVASSGMVLFDDFPPVRNFPIDFLKAGNHDLGAIAEEDPLSLGQDGIEDLECQLGRADIDEITFQEVVDDAE